MNFNNFEGLWSFIQNYLDNMRVKCIKFDLATFISFEIIDNK